MGTNTKLNATRTAKLLPLALSQQRKNAMTRKKNVFVRAFDAVIEGRTRHAAREIARYRDRFEGLNRF